MDVYKDFRFEAAHRLLNMPPEHKCGRLHGHSYLLRIYVRGEPDPVTGFVMDFADIKAVVAPVVEEQLDHRYLNDVEGIGNPTAENLARWIWERVRPVLPDLSAVEVRETCTCGAVFRGPAST